MSRSVLVAPFVAAALVTAFGSLPQRAAAATVLNVPSAYPTIQSAINAASTGDTVLVAAGTYNESIDFQSKAITVQSASGAASTIINGSGSTVVVKINANSGETPVLRGFTVRNGGGQFPSGGIDTSGGPALIENNTITANRFCDGGAVEASFSAATIRGNTITGNSQSGCSGGVGGAGISIRGSGTVQALGNVVSGNTHGSSGGGIDLFAAGSATISGNTIQNNVSFQGGGGISLENSSDATIVNNIITGNRASQGGGIYAGVPFGNRGPVVVNNTIAGNQASDGLAVYTAGFPDQSSFVNNILAGNGSGAVVSCESLRDQTPPILQYNDVWNSGAGARYAGACTEQTGLNGNIAASPSFVNAAGGDYHLHGGSAVDAGTSNGAPADDIDGDSRPLDGNGDGTAAVDIGADEQTGVFLDTQPPTISCTASPSRLTGPAHDLRSVSVTVSASDDSGSVSVQLVSVTSSELDSGLGSSDVPNDIQGWSTGTDDRSGLLRAEVFGASRIYTLSYQASDGSGNTAGCQTTVLVTDDVRPTISCTASPGSLWPPNQALRSVDVSVAASDDSGSVAVSLLSVTSSQADSGLAKEDMANDIQGWSIGTDDTSGLLRAERFGQARIYTLTYQAADPSGNTATCQTTVTVPLNQK